jgi:hypothetical protein
VVKISSIALFLVLVASPVFADGGLDPGLLRDLGRSDPGQRVMDGYNEQNDRANEAERLRLERQRIELQRQQWEQQQELERQRLETQQELERMRLEIEREKMKKGNTVYEPYKDDKTKTNGGYKIELSSGNIWFIIAREKYRAKTSCVGFEEGDYVHFLTGNAYGACDSATILNLRTNQTCEVICK